MTIHQNNMSSIAVSVIIPVYNVEKYLDDCLGSLVRQTLKNIEIICVDDGSTDGTLQILERYRQQDPRVQVYHQKNQFAGVARNNGMAHATGKYLLFLDSDDFFHETMLEKAYTEAERTNAQVVLFGACNYDNATGQTVPAPWLFSKDKLPKQLPFSAAETRGTVLSSTTPAPWSKLFLAEYIRRLGISYMPLKNSNDVYFTYMAMSCAERISYVDESLVSYRVNTGTSLQSTKSKNPLCFLEAYHATYRDLNKMGVYDAVEQGFRSATINGCVYNFNSVDPTTKLVIGNSFLSDSFTEMNLLKGSAEEVTDPDNFRTLENVISGFAWKRKTDNAPNRGPAHCLVQGTATAAPKVSVVIPCYNIEAYIGECLDSICGQTLRDIEIICVNDGSTDGTEAILKKYAQEDSRITILTQENGGQSLARNQGARIASGTYLYFMDGDDILETDALEVLYETAQDKALDILYFDGVSFYESQQLKEENSAFDDYYIRKFNYSAVVPGPEMLCKLRGRDEYRDPPWQQFIRRQFFTAQDLWFIPGIVHEDNAFSFRAILSAERCAHIPNRFYRRRVRANSTMTSKVRFAHGYGQFRSYLDMLSTLQSMTLTTDEAQAAALVLRDVIGNLRNKYKAMPYEERLHLWTLAPIEQELFRTLVSDIVSDAPDLSTSLSYRIGRAITFLPRMLRGTIRSLKQEGFGPTWQRILQKLGRG